MAQKPTGQAHHRRGAWVARVSLHRLPRLPSGRYPVAEVPVTRDGKPVTGRSPADRAHARRFATRAQGHYDDGSWEPRPNPSNSPKSSDGSPAPTPAELTVAAWCDRWCAGQTYGEASRDRARLAAYLPQTALGALPLRAVTPQAVAAWALELRRAKSPKTGEAPAPRTARNVFDVVRRALRSAVFEGHISGDPFAVLPPGTRPRAEDAAPEKRQGYRLRREEVEALVSSSSGRWRALWAILALTGARLGEALALRWSDLVEDAPLRRVVLARSLHHRTREVGSTKTREIRTVPEHPELRRELEAWRRGGWRAEYGRDPREEDFIVPAREGGGRPWGAAEDAGGAWRQQAIHRALGRALEALRVAPHRVHDLRHTFASLCADAGMRELVAARWTHAPGGGSARHLYAVPSWAAQCSEMQLLKVSFTAAPEVGARVSGGG